MSFLILKLISVEAAKDEKLSTSLITYKAIAFVDIVLFDNPISL